MITRCRYTSTLDTHLYQSVFKPFLVNDVKHLPPTKPIVFPTGVWNFVVDPTLTGMSKGKVEQERENIFATVVWNIGATAAAALRKHDCPSACLGIRSKSGAKLCSFFLQTTFLKAAIEYTSTKRIRVGSCRWWD